MPFIDQVSGNTINKANIDSDYNLAVNFPMSGVRAGFACINVEVDSGAVTGQRLVRTPESSWDSRLRISIDTPLFNDKFVDGLPQNTALYISTGTTMTIAASGGFLTLNDNLTTTTSTDARYQTWKTFPMLATFGTKFNCYAQLSQLPVSGNVTEWGLGIATARTEPTDGVFFRYSGTGLFAVANNNSISNISSGISTSLVGTGATRRFEINIQAEHATFLIDNNIVANIDKIAGSGIGSEFLTASGKLPLLLRTYNTDNTASAQQFKVSNISIFQQGANVSNPWGNQQAGMGAISSQGQSGMPMGSTANYTNNSSPIAASGSNTAALLGSGLGGQFIWSGTIANGLTDYIIDSYQVPAASSIFPGKVLYINGVNISQTNIVSGNTIPVTSVLTLAYGHTSESLATAESQETKAPRFIPLGVLSIPSGAVAGFTPKPLSFPFITPVVVNPSEYVSINNKFINGSGQTLNGLQFNIGIDGYWE